MYALHIPCHFVQAIIPTNNTIQTHESLPSRFLDSDWSEDGDSVSVTETTSRSRRLYYTPSFFSSSKITLFLAVFYYLDVCWAPYVIPNNRLLGAAKAALAKTWVLAAGLTFIYCPVCKLQVNKWLINKLLLMLKSGFTLETGIEGSIRQRSTHANTHIKPITCIKSI